jgi:hypothetical protein
MVWSSNTCVATIKHIRKDRTCFKTFIVKSRNTLERRLAYQPEADMNDEQVVNGLDVDPFVAAVVGGAQQIPEPSTLLLCIIALSIIGALRKWGV